jgi:hypothetical protein
MRAAPFNTHMPLIASRDVVLLLTHSSDFYTIDLVSQALTRRGVRPVRFNTDLFPSSVKLSARAGDECAAQIVTEAGEEISAAEVCAVWARKLWSPRMADDLDERYRAMCVAESIAALEGFLDALHDARWVRTSSDNCDWPRALDCECRGLSLLTIPSQRDSSLQRLTVKRLPSFFARLLSAWTPIRLSFTRAASAKKISRVLRHFVIARWCFRS